MNTESVILEDILSDPRYWLKRHTRLEEMISEKNQRINELNDKAKELERELDLRI